MNKNMYKKIFYLVGLMSMLTLNGCNNDKQPESTSVIETIKENTKKDDKNLCAEKHLYETSLDVKTLSDGSKYVTDAAVFYAIRERFLNNNILVNFENVELDDSDYVELLNNSNYLYMFNNTEVSNHLTYYMMGLKNMYPGLEMSEIMEINRVYEENDTNAIIRARYKFADNVEYNFSIDSYFSDYEVIDLDILSDTIEFSKYMHCNILGETKYSIIEQYVFSSIEKQGLNRIKLDLYLRYDLNKELISEQNYSCEGSKANITLNNGEDSLEVELTEEQFELLASLLTEAARNDMTVEQFLQENNDLIVEICGEEYSLFLEKTKAISYTLKKPVE